MIVWGIPAEEIAKIVENVSVAFDDNIKFKREPERCGRAVKFTLTVRASRKKGSRMSPSGRRIAAACWHVNREVMWGILAHNNDCRIKTAIADYHGLEDFADKYPDTGHTNVGSRMEPMDFQDACNCATWEACDV
jgi:hypothetical protein